MSNYAIHFGVYPVDTVQAIVDGHGENNVEHPIDLTNGGTIPLPPGLAGGFVSGSWGCWGPADQDTDGDNSLHVVFNVDRLTTGYGSLGQAGDIVAMLYDVLDNVLIEGRVLDYAVISDGDDWSEVTHVATFIGRPFMVIYPAGDDTIVLQECPA